MSPRTQSVLAWSLFVLILAGVVVNQIAQHTFDSLSIPYLAMALVGAVIVSRTGGNRVGWVMVGIGLIAVSSALTGILADRSNLPKWSLVLGSLFSDSMFFATLAGTFVFLPLLFPNGRPPTPRWGWVAWVAVGAVVVNAVLVLIQPTVAGGVPNPLGVAGAPGAEDSAIGTAVIVVLLACMVLAAASLVVRFRRSSGVERKQVAWLTYAVAMIAVTLVAQELAPILGLDVPDWIENFSFVFAVSVFPIAIGIAVLRYRLYDIGQLVRRTVTYTLVAVLLAAMYLGGIAAIGALVGRTSPLAVAGATLAAAALFNPVRRRVQAWVDHRFDRARYDTEQVVEGFSARLREVVDLDGLSKDLTGVVTVTLRPVSAGVVLIGESGR
jgi:uncharacterized membrane protein